VLPALPLVGSARRMGEDRLRRTEHRSAIVHERIERTAAG